jgi:formate/nitrite transporter FocA (FNT family)
VILGRQQLFTENTLTVILPLLTRRSARLLANVARLWVVVLVANLAGALLFAWLIGHTPAFEPDVRDTFGEIGREALRNDFGSSLVRGVFAGWLIALMVWLLPLAESARVFVIIILTYFVGLGSFTHIIAGATETFYAVFAGDASWGDCLARYTVPTLLGNVIGGVSLVAALNHAQVVAGKKEEKSYDSTDAASHR